MSATTEFFLMLAAAGGAIGAIGLAIRLVIRIPRAIDKWASDRVDHQRDDAALDCLIEMAPDLKLVVKQLEPNGGQSVYDLVHQNHASLSELKLLVRSHIEDYEESRTKAAEQFIGMHLMIERFVTGRMDH